MNKDEMIELYKKFHKNLEVLVANWIGTTGSFPSEKTVMDLLTWSYKQTVNPDQFETDGKPVRNEDKNDLSNNR